jgi:hypothetical protein
VYREGEALIKEKKMKLYNIKPVKETFPWGEMNVVFLGQEGRGRKLTIVPFHADIANLEKDNFQIGFSQKGYPKIISGECSDGYIAVLSGEGVYTRGTYGSVYVYFNDKEKIRLVAYGKGAYGIAGRIGEWYDYLVEIKPLYPIRFYVKPAGGEYKIEGYYLVFSYERIIKVSKEELNLFEEQSGIDLEGDYLDLVELII